MRPFPLGLLGVVVLFGIGWSAPAHAQGTMSDKNPVVILLVPEVTVEDSIVQLDQIARISGGSAILRQRIAKLDVAELRLGADRVAVSSEQVHFRLLLANIDASRFRISGAKRTVVVESDEPVTLRKIVGMAEGALRQRYPGDASSISLAPAKGIIMPLIEARPTDRLQFQAKARTPVPAAGKAYVDVWILVNGMTREVVTVPFEITAPDARPQMSGIDLKSLRPTVETLGVLEKQEVLIKARDNVKIIARVGTARIEATGEAQQDGKLGEVIRVRNLESSRVIHGRVEARGIVLVEY